jgi:signal peptidase I
MGTSEHWSAEREALVVDALRNSGHLRLGVRGESMLPALWPGDVVEVVAHSLPGVRPGEVVLISRQGRLYVHRFVAHSGASSFVARGDSMPDADPLYDASALLGKIEGVVRNGRTVSSPLTARFRHRALGFLFCHIAFARRVALQIHRWAKARGTASKSLEV